VLEVTNGRTSPVTVNDLEVSSRLMVRSLSISHNLAVWCVRADVAGRVDIFCNPLHTEPGGLSRLSCCQPPVILYRHSSDASHRRR